MCGVTEDIKVGVGVYQGSALIPYLICLLMDKITKKVQGEVQLCTVVFV